MITFYKIQNNIMINLTNNHNDTLATADQQLKNITTALRTNRTVESYEDMVKNNDILV